MIGRGIPHNPDTGGELYSFSAPDGDFFVGLFAVIVIPNNDVVVQQEHAG
jgi:hypothetical protein